MSFEQLDRNIWKSKCNFLLSLNVFNNKKTISRNFAIYILKIFFSLLKEAYIQAYPTQQPEEPIEQVGLISFKKKNSDEVNANDIEDNRLQINPYEDEVRNFDFRYNKSEK